MQAMVGWNRIKNREQADWETGPQGQISMVDARRMAGLIFVKAATGCENTAARRAAAILGLIN
eukprot:359027-Karenia_brevis.AAC.1